MDGGRGEDGDEAPHYSAAGNRFNQKSLSDAAFLRWNFLNIPFGSANCIPFVCRGMRTTTVKGGNGC